MLETRIQPVRAPGGSYDLNALKTEAGLRRAMKLRPPTDAQVAEYVRTNGMS